MTAAACWCSKNHIGVKPSLVSLCVYIISSIIEFVKGHFLWHSWILKNRQTGTSGSYIYFWIAVYGNSSDIISHGTWLAHPPFRPFFSRNCSIRSLTSFTLSCGKCGRCPQPSTIHISACGQFSLIFSSLSVVAKPSSSPAIRSIGIVIRAQSPCVKDGCSRQSRTS